ncbi:MULTISPECIES: pilus assembly protein TadG-related protein [Streptomyces]|uniref:Putative Flp pilus-assembly TadG-like N-terminal domain-containing protein n=1 Tax=Streptomyces viridochromogenes TaxID=1938 RepID=A0A0L8LC08_STRVR|nr:MULTISPECIES: pilus assembly protein TadG-related protein [Streptomyces]KOG35586.1 hypothetical protein ADK34_04965 [Streptomyces viridochromogenes]
MSAVAGLLFLAFVYFVVGQAAVNRSDAQTAADAAALAAAQDARDQLRQGWLDVIREPERWGRFLRGREFDDFPACQKAVSFAASNGADVLDGACVRLTSGQEGFEVTVQTRASVGRSIVPGTESRRATAVSRAVIEPKCTFVMPEDPALEELEPDPDAPGAGEEPAPEDETILELTCGGDVWVVEPDDPMLPSAPDLFTVRLAGDDE